MPHASHSCQAREPSAVGWVTSRRLLGIGHQLGTPREGGPEGERAARALFSMDTG